MPLEIQQESLSDRIRLNLERVQAQVDAATARAGRPADDVRLVVVTKSQPLEVVQAAIDAGARLLGENYVEEALGKIALLAGSGVEWHMIGHLQSRKAEAAVQNFSMIHSVDGAKLAGRLERFCAGLPKKLPILLEFNVSGEESKFGLPAWDDRHWDELAPELEKILDNKHLEVWGLMTMPPYFQNPTESRPYFQRLRQLRDFLADRFPSADLSGLSMGTSVDFQVAIEEGATFVRIGEAILGPRKKGETA